MIFNNKLLSAGVLALSITLSPVFANCLVDHGQSGFMPENNLQIPVGDKNANDMTKEKFNQIIDLAHEHYNPIVKAKRGILRWARKWDDATVNASAQRIMGIWQVNMYGGLARHALVTPDAFAMVVCHELGHHLGGAPKVASSGMAWASNEGQSDYFASLKCFRKIYEDENNEDIVASMTVDPLAQKQCGEEFSHPNDVALCIRSAMAGKSLADLLGSLGRTGTTNFATPDTNVVTATNHKHPRAQCRLDTYFSGALCDMGIKDELSDTNPAPGTCMLANGYTTGTRPLCWFKP